MRTKDDYKYSAIYKSTLKLTGQVGLYGLSMAAIAKESNIGTGSIYTYYPSKDILLEEVYKQSLESTGKILFSNYKAKEPVKVAIRKIFINYISMLLESHDIRVFQEQYQISANNKASRDIQAHQNAVQKPLTDIMERGKKELLIKNMPPKMFLSLLFGFGRELSDSIRNKAFRSSNQIPETGFILFWDAVKA